MRLVAVPFASRIHGEEYYRSVLEELSGVLRGLGVEVLPVVTDVDEARRAAESLGRGVRVPILLMLTGGTSRLARRFMASGDIKRAVVLAHDEHNSLASAISVRARLDIEGRPTTVYLCRRGVCGDAARDAVRIARAVSMLVGSRVGVVGREERDDEAMEFEMFADAEVVPVGFDELEGYTKAPSSDEVSRVVDELSTVLGVDRSPVLEEIARLYLGLRRLVKDRALDHVTIDCFPYILRKGYTPCIALAMLNRDGIVAGCEADLQALSLMVLARGLTGVSGWIANPSGFEDDALVLAHCTAALDVASAPRAVPHFETGRPYGIAARLSAGVYTVASLSYDYTVMAVARARLVRSGMLSENRCRTQAVLRIEGAEPARLLDEAPANHHVVMRGDVREQLRRVARLLSLELLDYSSSE
ncbi:MAG: hypothetical protein DRO39_08115 [Thermoprotei archaeon]|nr:MAG: hypothetical protein DRO39_08115 [Thermoprotei archaeon]